MSKHAYDTQRQARETTTEQLWQEIVALLPRNQPAGPKSGSLPPCSWTARSAGFVTRPPGLRLWPELLPQVSGWASSLHLSPNGARSWAKRTRQAAGWLLWIVEGLVQPVGSREGIEVPASFAGRIHLVDATCLRTWKRTGESRRLHCSETCWVDDSNRSR